MRWKTRILIAIAILGVLCGLGAWLGPAEAPQPTSVARETAAPVAPAPNSKGKGPRHCFVDCPPCSTTIDLTPHNKNDCRFTCEPIPDCTVP